MLLNHSEIFCYVFYVYVLKTYSRKTKGIYSLKEVYEREGEVFHLMFSWLQWCWAGIEYCNQEDISKYDYDFRTTFNTISKCVLK